MTVLLIFTLLYCIIGPLVIYNDISRMEDLQGKIVLLKTNLTGPVRLAGIRNEIAFNILASYGPIGIIYTNPVTRALKITKLKLRKGSSH